MKKARGSKRLQRKLYFERKQLIYEARAEKLRKAHEEKERKAKNLAELKENLTLNIEKSGGLWVDEAAISNGLRKIKTKKGKREALKLQLGFRNKVLGVKCDRSLLFLSSQGVNRTVEELKANLIKVIKWKESEDQPSIIKTFSEPIFLSEDVIETQKKKYLDEGNETTAKLGVKG